MNPFTIIFKSIAVLAAVYVTFVVLKRDRKKTGNFLFGIAFIFLGLYALDMIIFEFPISIKFNEIILNLSLYLLSIGSLLFIMAIQALIQSKDYLRSPINIIHCILLGIIYVIYMLFPYTVTSIEPEIIYDKDYISLITAGLFTVYLFVYNLMNIYQAIQKIDPVEFAIRKKFKRVYWAQIVGLIAPVLSVVGSILHNDVVVSLTFVALGVAIVILDLALVR